MREEESSDLEFDLDSQSNIPSYLSRSDATKIKMKSTKNSKFLFLMNLEMAEADPSKEEKEEKSAGRRGESPMEVTEALTHLSTLSTAMQLARPVKPDQDVKFLSI